VQDQWALDEASRAASNDTKLWPSWSKYEAVKFGKKDKVKCKDGLAIVEPGNVNQTFRCNNVSSTMHEYASFRINSS
jgi:hypothetical protein